MKLYSLRVISGKEKVAKENILFEAETQNMNDFIGEIFVPFVKLQEHAANFLTNAALDPNSRIPEYKVCAVRLEKV